MSLLLHPQTSIGLLKCSQRRSVAVGSVISPGMQKLMGSTRLLVLEHADQELQDLCASKSTPEEQAQCWEVRAVLAKKVSELFASLLTLVPCSSCWCLFRQQQVWKFYHDRRQQAQDGCVAELEKEGHEGSNCKALDNLERMVYEVAFSGDAEQLYHVLRVRCFCCWQLVLWLLLLRPCGWFLGSCNTSCCTAYTAGGLPTCRLAWLVQLMFNLFKRGSGPLI